MTADMTADTMIGHNQPKPPTPEEIRELLADENADLIRRRDELLDAVQRVPETIEAEDTCGHVSDFVKQISAAAKMADTRRVGAKEPYLAGGRTVDGFFKTIAEPLDKAKKTINARITEFLRRKEAEERRAREAAERAARESAEAERREAERMAREAADDAALDAAIEAEHRAKQAEADRLAADKAAHVKAAELSRTRGDYGAVASLRTTWDFEGLDRKAIDLETLRNHLPQDGIEKAIRAYIKAGGRELRGCRIYERTSAAVR